MATASQILGWLKTGFDKNKWTYEEIEGKNTLMSKGYPLDCKLKCFDLICNCIDDSFTSNAYLRLSADEDCRLKVAEYITRVNYGLRYGCFEMDFRDGEIRYRHTVDCADMTSLPERSFLQCVYLPANMFNRYGNGLVAVMHGVKSPEDAIKETEEN